MGQAHSSRVVQHGAGQPDEAGAAAERYAMVEEQSRSNLQAKMQALQKELRALIEEGMQTFPFSLLCPARCA